MNDERSEGGVVLPGKFPVDPNDPRKGNITPVLNAQQLTAGVMELMARTENLQGAVLQVHALVQSGLVETAELLEQLAIVVTSNEVADKDNLLLDESWNALVTYIEGRRQARAEMEAELAAQQAQADAELIGHAQDAEDAAAERVEVLEKKDSADEAPGAFGPGKVWNPRVFSDDHQEDA